VVNPEESWLYTWSTGVSETGLLSLEVDSAGVYTVEATADSGCPTISLPFAITEVSTLAPSSSFLVSPASQICTGSLVTFSPSITGGGNEPYLEWYVNDLFVGEGNSFSSDSLENGDRVQLVLTSSAFCANPVVALSSVITMFVQDSLQAYAGADFSICGNSAALQGNASGFWTSAGSSATIANPGSGDSEVNNLGPGLNRFVWTIEGGTCPESRDTVAIEVFLPQNAFAGSDQVICDSFAVLQAQVPLSGTGTWFGLSGAGTIQDSALPGSLVNNPGIGDNLFVWELSNGLCPVSRDTVKITREQPPGIALAGEDQQICGTSGSLSANNPAIGTGSWAILSGTGTLSDPLSPNSGISNLSGSTVLEWNIENGTCLPSSDTVILFASLPPSTAEAGSDQSVCAGSASLQAQAPSVGTGRWRVISGSAIFSDSLSPVSLAGNLSIGANDLEWKVSSGICPSSADTLRISRFEGNLNLGPDTLLCFGEVLLLHPGTGFSNFLWSDGSSGDSLLVNNPGWYSLQANGPGNCLLEDSILVTYQGCTSRSGFQTSPEELVVFPNPVSSGNGFSVSGLDGTFFRLALWSTEGRLVWKEEVRHASSRQQFIPGAMPAGMYLLEIRTETGIARKRLEIR
jgi:hypothetical protein